MQFTFDKANVTRALLIVIGVLVAWASRAGYVPADLASDLTLAAGVLLGTGGVQLTRAEQEPKP